MSHISIGCPVRYRSFLGFLPITVDHHQRWKILLGRNGNGCCSPAELSENNNELYSLEGCNTWAMLFETIHQFNSSVIGVK